MNLEFQVLNLKLCNSLEEENMENDEAKRRDGERSISDVSKVLCPFYLRNE